MTFLRLFLTLAPVVVGQVLVGAKVWNLATFCAVACAIAPIIIADVLELLWKDIWGTEHIQASDVHRHIEQMQAEIATNRQERRQIRSLLNHVAKKRSV